MNVLPVWPMRTGSASDPRHGISPTLLRLGGGEDLTTRVYEALIAKQAKVSHADVVAGIDRGDIGLIDNSTAFIHRPVPDEINIALPVLFENDRLVAVDKPAGFASTPQGSFVARSVLVQARRQISPDVTCAHRLDRATSGVLLLAKDPSFRGTYQSLFARGYVAKVYEFLSDRVLTPPVEYRSRLDTSGQRTVETQGEANARTGFELIADHGDYGQYRARPFTGKTHQIRAHTAALGIPIIGDTLYAPLPASNTASADIPADESRLVFPDRIELLAIEIAFTDPVDGETVVIHSRQELHPAGLRPNETTPELS